jgi:hypothetical protein
MDTGHWIAGISPNCRKRLVLVPFPSDLEAVLEACSRMPGFHALSLRLTPWQYHYILQYCLMRIIVWTAYAPTAANYQWLMDDVSPNTCKLRINYSSGSSAPLSFSGNGTTSQIPVI